jgi:tetratricopeptide (TPR) repeat protein
LPFVAVLLLAGVLHAQTLERAESLWRSKNYAAANDAFRALERSNPKNPDYKVRWGRLLLERFNRADAAALFKEALEINPKHAGATLGMALVAADGFEGAAAELARKALEYDPKLTEAQELLARLALEDNQPDQARKEAERALLMDPKSLKAESVLASADLMEHKDASKWLNRIASEHSGQGSGFETIGYFLQINRRYDDGIEWFKKAVATEPDLWSAHSQLGINLMRLGREKEAREELEACYRNGYKNEATVNTLRLMDSYANFVTFRTPKTVLRLHKKEAEVLRLYIEPEMERAIATYTKKYEFTLPHAVQLEVFPDHEDFAVRTMGMPGLGALGVTFQDVVAMDSPSGRPPGQFHWAGTMWHEFSHVFILSITQSRVPRWFTEGVAVHEETQPSADWGDRLDPPVIQAIKDKKLLPVAELDRGFIHPKYPAQVVISYYQAGKICDFIAKKWGEHKLLEMAHAFTGDDSTADVIEKQLGMKPDQFDKQFFGDLDSQTKHILDHFDQWQKDLKELNRAGAQKKWDEIVAKGPAVRDEFPEYVEGGNAYELLAGAYKDRGDSAKQTAELERYSKAGGRNPSALKELAKLLSKEGKNSESTQVLERLIYIAPLDEELHTLLGDRYLNANNASGAIREYKALVVGKSQDQAAAHFGLARAYKLAHRDADAKNELLEALEEAPNYKPAQKMLLEISTPHSD